MAPAQGGKAGHEGAHAVTTIHYSYVSVNFLIVS
jgi:hypothetical protein